MPSADDPIAVEESLRESVKDIIVVRALLTISFTRNFSYQPSANAERE
jgi:hypothetical protein